MAVNSPLLAGGANVAVGNRALAANTIGAVNTAVGSLALETNTTGTENTAVGRRALEFLDGGHENTAVGWGAGSNYTGTETNNICIGDQTSGVTGENNNIRIGENSPSEGIVVGSNPGINAVIMGTGLGSGGLSIVQTILGSTIQVGANLTGGTCFIGDISGADVGASPLVRVTAAGQLGVNVSSARFKKDIESMGKTSEAIFSLRPVTFHYKRDVTNTPAVGLIAEEVAKVNPDLIFKDKEGKPFSVRYEDINVLLLNEFLKEHKKVEEQQASIAELKSTVAQQKKDFQATVAQLTARLDQQASEIQKVSAQVEMSKPAPQVVVNKP